MPPGVAAARRARRGLAAALASWLIASWGCGPPVELQQVLQVTDLAGGYFDAGIVDGRNKLQPTVSFRIVRQGDRPNTISLNVHFRKIVGNELEEFDEVYMQTVEFTEGNRTGLITARPDAGYTGEQPRAEMLKHSQFQDMRILIFARQSSSNWVELATFDLPRQVLTR